MGYNYGTFKHCNCKWTTQTTKIASIWVPLCSIMHNNYVRHTCSSLLWGCSAKTDDWKYTPFLLRLEDWYEGVSYMPSVSVVRQWDNMGFFTGKCALEDVRIIPFLQTGQLVVCFCDFSHSLTRFHWIWMAWLIGASLHQYKLQSETIHSHAWRTAQ